jgi:hypothetical protein
MAMEENYSKNSREFVDNVEKFSHSKLLRKAALLRIFEEAVKSEKEQVFEDLTFTAKYVQGLLRVINKGKIDAEVNNLEDVKKDLSSIMNKAVGQIQEIISGANDELKDYFKESFFTLSQESLLNLNELLHDLEWTKMYMNDFKRNQ